MSTQLGFITALSDGEKKQFRSDEMRPPGPALLVTGLTMKLPGNFWLDDDRF